MRLKTYHGDTINPGIDRIKNNAHNQPTTNNKKMITMMWKYGKSQRTSPLNAISSSNHSTVS